ncbi:MAG TPA: tRNA (N6-isopentenyl adenosine(37)-C2)-methylthiotransferase MiaB [Desulfobacteraceae bacterium]|nr:tRNA (N6-isopentenyl adenosine(37)-C2)-methylthiotransferase MiaB [Desulfobacteraceae bacterium]
MKQRNLYIKTFGCQMNERDSEIIAQLLHGSGFIPVHDMDAADLIILNTCSIRAKAEQKVYSLLGQLRQYKLKNPDLLISVAGCVAQQEGERIQRKMPHVDLVVGTQQLYRLPEMIRRLDNGAHHLKPAVDISATFAIPSIRKLTGPAPEAGLPFPAGGEIRKFVTIMQGCNNYCSYCVVPYTRGREISRPVADILDEVGMLAARGVREITLLGQNVNSYGQTNPVADRPVDFPALLHRVARTEGLRRLRFTTSNPKDLSDRLMRCFAEIDILCPNFHLPVQSGSDRILQRMNRKYTVADYLDKVRNLRRYHPDITLSTDMIVGFPGETDEDFEQTMLLLETVRFHSSFSFKYSDRPRTRSATFGEKVPEQVKAARLGRFQARQDSISLERNREYVDRVVEVMVEGAGKNNLLQGRAATNHIVHFPEPPGSSFSPGDMVMVRINRAGQHSLAGTMLMEDSERD